MPQSDDKPKYLHSLIFPQPLREVVLPELEQFFQRCEQRGVSRNDARACIASRFLLEDVARGCEEARLAEAKSSA